MKQISGYSVYGALVLCAGLLAFCGSLTVALFSLQLERLGHSTLDIGIANACQMGAVLLTLVTLPKMLRIIATTGTLLLLAGLEAVFWLALLALPDLSLGWHCLLRLCLGADIYALYILIESATNQLCCSERRGRRMAIYAAAILFGFAAGPFALSLVPSAQGGMLLALSALLVVAAVGLSLKASLPSFVLPSLPFGELARQYPVIVSIGISYGAIEAALFSHLPLAGLLLGYSAEQALRLLTIVMLGGLLLQYPIGRQADRRQTLNLLATMALLASLLSGGLILTAGTAFPFWISLLLYGGILTGHYTLALVLLGNQCALQPHGQLSSGTLLLVVCYGIGGVIGPVLSGLILDAAGGSALFALLGGIHLLGWLWLKHHRKHA